MRLGKKGEKRRQFEVGERQSLRDPLLVMAKSKMPCPQVYGAQELVASASVSVS